jgi:hypothetical protein
MYLWIFSQSLNFNHKIIGSCKLRKFVRFDNIDLRTVI